MAEPTETTVLDGRSLTPAEVATVARAGRTVRLDDAARARNAAAAEALARLAERGAPIYGVTTGVGALRSRKVPPGEREDHQLRLLRSHACGAGRPLAVEQVRATMVVRANQLGAGGGGVSDELLDSLVAALNAGFVPFTRELGSLGTGDLTVLADIALALLGEGLAWQGRNPVPGRSALAAAGLTAPRLGPRDGIAFMSSNAASIGDGALVAVDAERLLAMGWRWRHCRSWRPAPIRRCSIPRVHAARAHPGQVAIAARLTEALGPGARRGRRAARSGPSTTRTPSAPSPRSRARPWTRSERSRRCWRWS